MKNLLILLALLTLAACGSDDAPQKKETAKQSATKEHMLSDQEKMIQKAKEAEDRIKEADEKRRKALKEQGG
ncbi:MAG: hypothetical protein KDI92_09265 [Xanthomonadales bacterium]|nr:hypothetical protein [Xanthomonadales bacterium]